jgi:hypothetical protein
VAVKKIVRTITLVVAGLGVLGLLGVLGALGVALNVQDIRRYLRMRRM